MIHYQSHQKVLKKNESIIILQEKLQKMEENFNVNKFLEKEKEEGINTDFLGRRKSYLNFLHYTEKGIIFMIFYMKMRLI
jgi:hypothetical protein